MARNATRRLVAGALVAAALWLPGASARLDAQGRRQAPRGHISPSDIQDQFDAYAIVQAQDALQLTDEQYPRFVRRARELHTTRRRMQARRTRLVAALGQLVRARDVSETRIDEATRALDAHDRATLDAVQKAYAALDEVLDVRQRARFRVLEQQLERKKIEMLFRARQGGRR